ncbi:MAG TPA: TIGR03084 family metal-binding protein [Acidimicrobiales bacterium]|nr:TIGR03084 family metal-binding protein [Acidimicrobiales bacterium]
MSGADLDELGAHLAEETVALRDALEVAGADAWATPTPADGWSVADQVSHLAYFDEAATASVGGPARFAPYLEEATRLGASLCDVVAARTRGRPPDVLSEWWAKARAAMVAAMVLAGPSTRVPWYGPDFSVASSMTGRIMETWAHGQDVYDALGRAHPVTGALYDVARLCARTRANSYAAHGRVPPETGVAVELDAPGGARWRFGDDDGDRITGDAVEFCLVATQRRHRADTALEAEGAGAAEWLGLAQAFAGPPGAGRAPSGRTR